MKTRHAARLAVLAVIGLVLGSCGTGGPPPSATSGEPFSIQVVPAEDPVAIRTAIPGQRSAAEISSVIDEVPPIEVTPPEVVFR
jgi:hypothetical protein